MHLHCSSLTSRSLLALLLAALGCASPVGAPEENEDKLLDPLDPACERGTPPFSDHLGHPAGPEIEWLYGQCGIAGRPDGRFDPNGSITRGEFAAMLRALTVEGSGWAAPARSRYTDNPERHWSWTDLARATDAGFFGGYPDGTIRPDGAITNAEVVAALAGGLSIPEVRQDCFWCWDTVGAPLLRGHVIETFADVEGNEWFFDALVRLYASTIVIQHLDLFPQRLSDNALLFQPARPATRAFVAAIVTAAWHRLRCDAYRAVGHFPVVGRGYAPPALRYGDENYEAFCESPPFDTYQ